MTDTKGAKQVREPVQVYLDRSDVELLADLVRTTGLTKAELLRRGLRRLSGDALGGRAPGWSFDRLVGALDETTPTPDLSARHDVYLYGRPRSRGKPRPG